MGNPCVHTAQVGSPSEQCKCGGHEQSAQSVELGDGGFSGLGCEKVNNDVGFFELAHGHEQSDGCPCGHTGQLKVTHDGLACCVATDQAVASHQGDEG